MLMRRMAAASSIPFIAVFCAVLGWTAAAQESGGAPPAPADVKDESDGWDLSLLDTARSTGYMSDLEKDVILEMNKARANPARYAELYIAPRIKSFDGKLYEVPGRISIRTNEGSWAVQQCVEAMKKQPARPPFQPLEALYLAARDHVADTGPKGIVSHTGSDGSDLQDRLYRYMKPLYGGENLYFGGGDAREIVAQFLIDDGVPSRGHRTLLFKEEYVYAGAAVGPHKIYESMCTVDFARAKEE